MEKKPVDINNILHFYAHFQHLKTDYMNGRDDTYADCVFDLADIFEDEGR